jgi:hypothetical protein
MNAVEHFMGGAARTSAFIFPHRHSLFLSRAVWNCHNFQNLTLAAVFHRQLHQIIDVITTMSVPNLSRLCPPSWHGCIRLAIFSWMRHKEELGMVLFRLKENTLKTLAMSPMGC